MDLLKQLTQIPGASSDESKIKEFILQYIQNNQNNWKVKPQIHLSEDFQDAFCITFGKPKTAVFAHMDTVGFSVGYHNRLIKIGSPKMNEKHLLVGKDSIGEIECEVLIIENEYGFTYQAVYEREIERGTILTYKPNFKESKSYITSPYLDNRLGVCNVLKLAENLENGAIVFSTYEEHGGNTVSYIAKYLKKHFGINRALISDITWVTEGVLHGGGVAISMRDSGLPRKKYLNEIIELAKKSGIPFQLEVESSGGSDGTMIQKSETIMDWVFIGAPEDNVHSPEEKVHKKDIESMLSMYHYLMKKIG
ncbi:MAG: aminopeptidase [Flavobacteriia bacterium]|nr:aminopeptidase [Flavobacteriia bacterium]